MSLAEYYPVVKATHVGLALLSGAIFAGRGVGVLLGATMPMSRAVRRTSQLVDTALLVAALVLLATLGLNPFTTPWLSVKLALLVCYIGFGTLALRRAPRPAGKAVAFAIALVCYALIVQVARTHDPLAGLG